jgi:hypothetical protein
MTWMAWIRLYRIWFHGHASSWRLRLKLAYLLGSLLFAAAMLNKLDCTDGTWRGAALTLSLFLVTALTSWGLLLTWSFILWKLWIKWELFGKAGVVYGVDEEQIQFISKLLGPVKPPLENGQSGTTQRTLWFM